MPDLSEEIRLKAEQVLGIKVLKVKWTDDPNVCLALCGNNTGVWLNRDTWQETEPATIYQENIVVGKPRGYPKVAKKARTKKAKK